DRTEVVGIVARRLLHLRLNGDQPRMGVVPGERGRRMAADAVQVSRREDEVLVVVVVDRQGELLEVVGALDASGGLPRRLDRRQQQGDQYRNDGDDDEQFDQREATRTKASIRIHRGGSSLRWTDGGVA